MERSSTPPATPAPYGQSCVNCVQSKRKCLIRRPGEPCERCFKAKRECHAARTVRRRGVRKTAASQTSRIEGKIDSIVSMMSTATERNTGVAGYVATTIDATEFHPDQATMYCPSSNHHIYPHSMAPHVEHPFSWISDEECLEHFKTTKLPYFPFVYIPLATTPQTLQQERPFLWLCIKAVSAKSTAEYQVLNKQVKQVLAEQMVMQSEKNIDLLLGLLTCIGWANCQVHSKSFLPLFNQLAISLVHDLGLNKPVIEEQPPLCSSILRRRPRPSSPRTMEERRAVLGCFLITSIISSFLQKVDPLRWTPHLNVCLQFLEQEKQCFGDETLVWLVRMQHIADNAPRTISPNMYSDRSDQLDDSTQLDHMRESLEMSPKNVLMLHFHSIQFEIARTQIPLHHSTLAAAQQQSLQKGFESIIAWLEFIFAIPEADYPGLPFSIVSQLIQCLKCLYRFATLDCPGWDKHYVRTVCHPIYVLDRVIYAMDQVPIAAGLDRRGSPEGDVYTRSANVFRSLRAEWQSKLQLVEPESLVRPSPEDVGDLHVPEPYADDLMDTEWFMDLLASPI